MIKQIRGKLAAIINYRPSLREKKDLQSSAFSLKLVYKLIIME